VVVIAEWESPGVAVIAPHEDAAKSAAQSETL
jgi:hypothetical protein